MIATIATIAGGLVGIILSGKIAERAMKEKGNKVDKYRSYYEMLNQWMNMKQQGISLTKYFIDHNYKNIAIYGMGEMGNRLYEELVNTEINVLYAVDKEAMSRYAELTVLEIDDELPVVDAMIVTATFAFDEIEEILSQKIEFPIISLDSVIFEL